MLKILQKPGEDDVIEVNKEQRNWCEIDNGLFLMLMGELHYETQ